MNIDLRITLNEDSSAAKGIAQRTGLGKVRHIEVNQLWVQEKVREGTFEICKVKGIDNLADALTKGQIAGAALDVQDVDEAFPIQQHASH